MILVGAILVENNQKVVIRIEGNKISEILEEHEPIVKSELCLTFTDAIVFPGLINSHDHLDFNLFPQLGEPPYQNYTDWGKHIHVKYADEIAADLKIPKLYREHWGIYKNLLCGVTTVVNHGENTLLTEKLIHVLENNQDLHSVKFEKWWKIKLNNPFKRQKNVVIHTGEGTDLAAKEEIDILVKWNLMNRKLIGIHGVAMKINQAKSFKALVWCPESNYFLLHKTAKIDLLKHSCSIVFGTDSTLTSNWNIWNHITLARNLQLLADQELYQTLTRNPAKLWNQSNGEIKKGFAADVVIARRKNNPVVLDAFFKTQPADLLLVVCKGEILLFDEEIKSQLTSLIEEKYQKIKINGNLKYVFGELHQLIEQIKIYHPNVQFPEEFALVF